MGATVRKSASLIDAWATRNRTHSWPRSTHARFVQMENPARRGRGAGEGGTSAWLARGDRAAGPPQDPPPLCSCPPSRAAVCPLSSHLARRVSWASLKSVKVLARPNAEGSMATPRMDAYSVSTRPKAAMRSKPGTGSNTRGRSETKGEGRRGRTQREGSRSQGRGEETQRQDAHRREEGAQGAHRWTRTWGAHPLASPSGAQPPTSRQRRGCTGAGHTARPGPAGSQRLHLL